jgi:hypothetical protein
VSPIIAGIGVLGGKVGNSAGGAVGTGESVGWSGRGVQVMMGGGQCAGTAVGAGTSVQKSQGAGRVGVGRGVSVGGTQVPVGVGVAEDVLWG